MNEKLWWCILVPSLNMSIHSFALATAEYMWLAASREDPTGVGGASGLQPGSSGTGDSEVTQVIPVGRVLGSAIYLVPPSNLNSSHGVGSRECCLAAFPVCVCVWEREGAVISDNRMWSGNTEEKAEFY